MNALFARNLEAFGQAFPQCTTLLPSGGRTLSRLVRDNNGEPVNIDLGNGMLYQASAPDVARDQVETYLAAPIRVLANAPTGTSLDSNCSIRMVTSLVAELQQRKYALARQPTARSGYLIIIGVGLGLHLLPLIERLDVHNVIITESHAEFCWHSLFAADWRGIVDLCERKKTKLHMVIASTPEQLANGIGKVLVNSDAMFLDGTYIFTHYPSWAHNEMQKRVYSSLNQYYVSRGYFEDELKMIRNATGNFLRHSYHLIAPKPRPKRREPAFIVGSGPSVEKDIETIRRWKDHAIIFSCGSGLQVLLSHGIQPDFQVDLENGPYIPEIAEHVAQAYDLKPVRLIASATVDPRTATFYRELFLFFRDSVSSTMTLGTGIGHLSGTAPTAVNSGLGVASAWEFDEIYLFGVDCGSKTKAQHSSRSIYHTMEQFRKQEAESEFTVPVPGNFGGMVKTDWVFDMSRRMIEALRRQRGFRLFNCSDGARIAGAVPKLSGTIAFHHPPLDKERVIAELASRDLHFCPGDFFTRTPMAPFVEACDGLEAALRQLLDAAAREDDDLVALFERVDAFLETSLREFRGVPRVFGGSAYGLIRVASYFISRVVDERERREMFRFFLERYRAELEMMVQGTRAVFTETAAAVHESGG